MRAAIALCLALLGACGAAQDDETPDLPEADEVEERTDALTPCASGSTCLRGTYAVRSARFVKTRSGSDVSGKKTVEYALVTITRTWLGTLRLNEKLCYSESVPLAGPTLYEWSKPAWLEALPALTTSLTRNANGTYTRSTQVTAQGWSAARQPSSCTSASTPLAPWPAAWGASCRCSTPASSLPPFNLSVPYDCRALDADLDGYPGWSSFASVTPPSAPASDPSGIGWARLLQASNEQTTW
ncbi:MAG TPA: hypothetical protein VJU61_02085, partial [Polyangiaceae bacterium]|nr:hypothetical protein [Polyangiaceae bacterium]